MKTWIAISLLAATAQAGQRCYSSDRPPAPTNWATSVTFPKHDAAIGVLQSVTITVRAPLVVDVGVENLGVSTKGYQIHAGSNVKQRIGCLLQACLNSSGVRSERLVVAVQPVNGKGAACAVLPH